MTVDPYYILRGKTTIQTWRRVQFQNKALQKRHLFQIYYEDITSLPLILGYDEEDVFTDWSLLNGFLLFVSWNHEIPKYDRELRDHIKE